MRHRFQFTIRSLLLLTFAVSLPLGPFAWRQKNARENFQRIYGRLNAFRALGGQVDVHIAERGEPVIGDGATASPPWYFIALHLADSKITDQETALIAPLSTLKTLDLRRTRITDAGLRHLRGLKSLRRLDLADTKVTDAGVAELEECLPKCVIAH